MAVCLVAAAWAEWVAWAAWITKPNLTNDSQQPGFERGPAVLPGLKCFFFALEDELHDKLRAATATAEHLRIQERGSIARHLRVLPIPLRNRDTVRTLDVAVADRELDAAHQATSNQERVLSASVRLKYGEVLTAIRTLSVTEQLVSATRRQRALVTSRVEQGAAPPLDRDMLRVEEQKLEADRRLQAGVVERRLVELKRLLGMPADATLSLRESLEVLVHESARRRPLRTRRPLPPGRMSAKPRRGSTSRRRRSIGPSEKDAPTSISSACTCAWTRAFLSRDFRRLARSNAYEGCSITGRPERW